MAVPTIPSNFVVQNGNAVAYLSWTIVPGATAYAIYRSTDNSTYTLIASPTTLNYTDSTVSINTAYYYKLAATNVDGNSPLTTAVYTVITKPGVNSLYELRTEAQQRADMVNSNFVSYTEWNSYINQSALELYDLLITCYEDYYMAEPYIFQTNGTAAYDLPNGTLVGTDSVVTKNFYKLLGVDMGLSEQNNAKVALRQFDFINRNDYVYPAVSATYYGVFNAAYRIMGDKIRFIPTPASGQYITLWYIPRLERLVADTDVLTTISGWNEYIIVDAAIKALQKQEQDITVLMAQKMALKQRIEETAINRNAGEPQTISRSRGVTRRNGGGGFTNGGSGGF